MMSSLHPFHSHELCWPLVILSRNSYQAVAAEGASDPDGGRVQRLREFTRDVMAAVDRQHPRSMDQV